MRNMKKIILVRGLPGSGKTKLAMALSNAMTGFIEADMFFVNPETSEYHFDGSKLKEAHQWCQDTVEGWMKPHGFDDIIVSNTFTQEWEMEPYFEMAKKYGYTIFSIIVENRHNGKNQHEVPEEKIEKMRNRFNIKL